MICRTLPMLLVATSLGACRGPGTVGEGIAVGNPGSTKLQTARSSEAPLLSADAALEELRLVDCAGNTFPLASNIALGLDGTSSIAVPSGVWCGVGMSFDGPAVFEHQLGEGTLRLELDLGDIEASGEGVGVDGAAYVLQLGQPELIAAADWAVPSGETLVVDGDHPDHELLATAVSDWLLLAEDLDEDGTLTDTDTIYLTTPAVDEALAEDDDDEDDEDDED